ncbi:hypothetical protein PPROV_000624000 [Pycnococcus provasolii]|uniref:Uncharacterized protein n=1 Tax=Pycnococcus provasolii TaxID=41880 RepID=A0A830HKU7_9CHLO|nr:hypothetical protein PPROV_000624000 [Pycnococcus provasolii]
MKFWGLMRVDLLRLTAMVNNNEVRTPMESENPTAVQAVDRLFRVALVEDATAAFSPEWHRMGVALLNEPQTQPGHAQKATGLYFGELTTVADVEKAMAP